LKGENGKMFTHLAVEKNFLFALRADGNIIQYDLTTVGQTIIPTLRVRDNIVFHSPVWTSLFHIEQGYIFIRYEIDLDHVFEIIPYENIEKRSIVEETDISHPYNINVYQEKLYILENKNVFIWDLHSNEKICNLQLPVNPANVYDRLIEKNKLFVLAESGLYVVDLETKEAWKEDITRPLRLFEKIENLFFASRINRVFDHLHNPVIESEDIVMDLNTGKTIAHFQDVLKDGEIKPEVLKQLVEICRLHSKKLELPSNARVYNKAWKVLAAVVGAVSGYFYPNRV
jgi:hypothetical protein